MARQKIEFQGHDGSTLSGLLEIPAQEVKAWALFAHCFSCGKDIAAASRISRALVREGFAVLRFDFTGLGNSDGDFANTNFSSNVEDLRLAVAFLRSNYEAPQLVVGHSLGGTAVLAMAGDIPEVKAVATLGAPMEPAHVLHQFSAADLDRIKESGAASVDLAGRSFTIQSQFIEDVVARSQEEVIRKLRKPLLVMHSPLDKTVSINEAEKIYKSARHPKSFVTLDQADHLLSNKDDAAYVASMLATWSGRYVERSVTVQNQENPIHPGQVLVTEHNHDFARRVATDHHEWLADEPVGVGGQDLGPDPYEHLLAALGTCTSMTLRMYANRKKLALEDVHVTLRHERSYVEDCEGCDEEPRQIENLYRRIRIEGDLTDAERQKLIDIADRCPVHRTLESDLQILTES